MLQTEEKQVEHENDGFVIDNKGKCE